MMNPNNENVLITGAKSKGVMVMFSAKGNKLALRKLYHDDFTLYPLIFWSEKSGLLLYIFWFVASANKVTRLHRDHHPCQRQRQQLRVTPSQGPLLQPPQQLLRQAPLISNHRPLECLTSRCCRRKHRKRTSCTLGSTQTLKTPQTRQAMLHTCSMDRYSCHLLLVGFSIQHLYGSNGI